MTSGFHVHGPHDHHVHEASQGEQHGGPRAGRIAVVTAVLATLGAICSFMGGTLQAEAALVKNDAAIRKTEASDQWSYYQAKNERQSIAELAVDLLPADRRDPYRKAIDRYKGEKDEIMAKARALEAEAKVFDDRSERLMRDHDRWAGATMLLQISIALAAIALLTHRHWLEYATYAVGAIGVAIGLATALSH